MNSVFKFQRLESLRTRLWVGEPRNSSKYEIDSRPVDEIAAVMSGGSEVNVRLSSNGFVTAEERLRESLDRLKMMERR